MSRTAPDFRITLKKIRRKCESHKPYLELYSLPRVPTQSGHGKNMVRWFTPAYLDAFLCSSSLITQQGYITGTFYLQPSINQSLIDATLQSGFGRRCGITKTEMWYYLALLLLAVGALSAPPPVADYSNQYNYGRGYSRSDYARWLTQFVEHKVFCNLNFSQKTDFVCKEMSNYTLSNFRAYRVYDDYPARTYYTPAVSEVKVSQPYPICASYEKLISVAPYTCGSSGVDTCTYKCVPDDRSNYVYSYDQRRARYYDGYGYRTYYPRYYE